MLGDSVMQTNPVPSTWLCAGHLVGSSMSSLRKFSKKKFASFPSIFARISMFEHFRSDWAYAEPNFFDELSKIFFLRNLHFGPIRWVPRRFLKILIYL